MNVDDLKSFPAPHFGGQVDYQDATKVVAGSALLARMVRFLPDQVETCFGTVDTMKRLQPYEEVTGINVLDVLGVLNPGEIPVLFGDLGSLLEESPAGTGALVPLTPPFPLPANARMQSSDAENRMHMAISDGKKGLVPPITLDGISGNIAAAQNPIGGLWSKDLIYQLGDLVRAADGRWWRCTLSASTFGSSGGPQWPAFNGYFSNGAAGINPTIGQWNPATANDPVGGSAWEEWTPIAAQYLPTPDVSNVAVVNNPGGGTITAGRDVYIKVCYRVGGYISPRSLPLVFLGTGVNDALTFGQNVGAGVLATNGGLNMPRWMAEILLRPDLFSDAPSPILQIAVYIADVAHGAPAPADSAYHSYNLLAATPPCQSVTLINLGTGTLFDLSQGAPVAYFGPTNPSSFLADIELGGYIGRFGQRYMLVERINKNGSLAPVDRDSAIAVTFIGQLKLPIVSIVRDGAGNVQCTVGDVTAGWIIGKSIRVGGCTGDPTFNGNFILTNIEPTLSPQGILSWKDAGHASASNDDTGTVELPAGPPPVAFLPPGGPNDLQDIAAFSVVDSSAAGPFFYVSQSLPKTPANSAILKMEGARVIDFPGINLTRDAGGFVSAALANIAGISVGNLVTVSHAVDPSFDGQFTLQGVTPGVGTAGELTWAQDDTNGAATTGELAIQVGISSSVQITVQDASGFAAGDICLADTGALVATGVLTSFDSVVTIARISGNVITVPLLATGVAVLHPGAILKIIQQLPTTAPAAPQTILTIARDAKGNVQATVADVSGYAPGNALLVEDVPTASFNGPFELLGVKANADGRTGTLSWSQAGVAAASDVSGIGTVSGAADILINYEDEFLTSESDNEVTSQLRMTPPPPAADVYFVPSIRKFVYTTGLSSIFLFSETDDAENVDLQNGSLSVDDNSMSLAICVREARTGEIIALKADGGYAINPSDLGASQWPCPTRWVDEGPPCAAAVGKGKDFLIFPSFWSQAGCYLYSEGRLDWLTEEFQKVWNRVNTAALNTIWTVVDEQEKEVQIGVPLDGATTPSHIIVGSYIGGWGPQEVLSRYGKLITARSAVRWSLRPRATRTAAVVRRTLATPQPSLSVAYRFSTVTRTAGVVTASYAGMIDPMPILGISRIGGVVFCGVGFLPRPFVVGDTVPVIGVGDASFDGSFEVLAIIPIRVGHVVIGFGISWQQPGPDASSAGGTIGSAIPETVPPVLVPDGAIKIQNVADPTFNGDFLTIASGVNSLTWLQDTAGPPQRISQFGYVPAFGGVGTLVIAGVIPAGAIVGTRLYIRGSNSTLDGVFGSIATIVQGDGFYTVTFAVALGGGTFTGIGGKVQFFNPPPDAVLGSGTSFMTTLVENPLADERVNRRQVLLAPSGRDPFESVPVVSADRRTGVRGDLTVGGVITLRFAGPLDGDVTSVIVSGMNDPSFDGIYDQPCTAAWGPDGKHAILQFKTSGLTGVAYGGVLQSTIECLRVVMQDPTRYDDNGTGLDSRYTPAFAQANGIVVLRWGAFSVQVDGNGTIFLTPQNDEPKDIFAPIEVNTGPEKTTKLTAGLRVTDSEYLTLEVSNGNKPGCGFVLQDLVLYGVPLFSGRRI